MLREVWQRMVTSDVIDTLDDVFWPKQDELRSGDAVAVTLLDGADEAAVCFALIGGTAISAVWLRNRKQKG